MLFNSLVFVAFFAIVYGAYRLLSHRPQNRLLLVASYVFYGYWDWRFLSLIALSTVIDFCVGRAIPRTANPRRKRRLLAISVAANLTILGTFKYLGFFSESLASLLETLGMTADPLTLHVILPVGISFYTFQTMSYTIDIYRGKLEPIDRFEDFALFVAFFPQLVAGPIERARSLLPQIARPRTITPRRTQEGLFLILWGYYKKVFIADNLAVIANTVFNDPGRHQGLDVLLGVLAFAFQIYGDFSGYTDIARGIGKLMGFELRLNFRLPYFAVSPSDFWRRWHVSLSTWLRDYLYISLGGSRGGAWRTQRNLALTMLLGGLWHGAAWTFVLWGAFHGIILVVYRIARRPFEAIPAPLRDPRWIRPIAMALMFVLTLIGWIIFRANSVADIGLVLGRIGLSTSELTGPWALDLLAAVWLLLLVQVWQQASGDLLAPLRLPKALRFAFYLWLFYSVALFGARHQVEFIYYQF